MKYKISNKFGIELDRSLFGTCIKTIFYVKL